MDRQEAERIIRRLLLDARQTADYHKSVGNAKCWVESCEKVEAFTLVLAALSDRGYEQGYKDGQEQALASIGHIHDPKDVPESVTTATESLKCPKCGGEAYIPATSATAYCWLCKKCGHRFV
jgi:hypothetical protein